ncbi:hypothetical protein LPJ60_005729, partial [Coemansia sp. RSA 2675]
KWVQTTALLYNFIQPSVSDIQSIEMSNRREDMDELRSTNLSRSEESGPYHPLDNDGDHQINDDVEGATDHEDDMDDSIAHQ